MKISKRKYRTELKLNTNKVKKQLVKFIKERTADAGFTKAIIGVSGGVDSAVSTLLAVEALGKENVIGVMMPYRTSNPKNLEDAKLVIQKAGIRSELVNISKTVDAYCDEQKVTDPIRRGNVMARTRMIVLYDISARERALVIGTSNKTEILVGYGTMFGDLACAINPLGNLYKAQIWQLAEVLGVPGSVIEKAPSADLWEGQTDEGEIGVSYAELDELLFEMIGKKQPDGKLIKMGFDPAVVKKIRSMNQANQFKGRLPIIAKIS
jgi:NAD+ synthase